MTRKKNFTQAVTQGHNQPQTKQKRQYLLLSLAAILLFVKQKGALPTVTVLPLFYESVNMLMETKEIIEKKRNNTTKQIGQKN